MRCASWCAPPQNCKILSKLYERGWQTWMRWSYCSATSCPAVFLPHGSGCASPMPEWQNAFSSTPGHTVSLSVEKVFAPPGCLCCTYFNAMIAWNNFGRTSARKWSVTAINRSFEHPALRVLRAFLDGHSYRLPRPVVEVRTFPDGAYPLCPRCHRTVEREYMSYCDRCGQCLDWNGFDTAV